MEELNKNLVCRDCLEIWEGKSWIRKNGRRDYRCVCGSKRKPIKCDSPLKEKNNYSSYGDLTKDDLIKGLCEVRSEDIKLSNNRNSKTKKILVLSDLHCGQKSGLTPPGWFCNKSNKKRRAIQEESWNWFSNKVDEIGSVDVLVVNGDAIDGKGSRSGGTELITSDLFKQVKIAERCINEVNFNSVFFTFGTQYHVSSDGDDFETALAEKYNATIKDHLWLDVNGCTFDFKHKLGSSSILQGRTTALLKEYMWNREWCKNGAAPKADVFVRSHVHYCNSVTDYDSFFCITTPALQVADTKFGGRICTGTVDFGCVLFEIPENYSGINDLGVRVFKHNLESMKSKSILI